MSGLPPTSDRNFLARVRERLLVAFGTAGDPLDAMLTRRDLVDAGIINVRMMGPGPGAPGGGIALPSRPVIDPSFDPTPPPRPGGFQATAGVTQILFETAAPVYRQGHGHARTKIYAAPVSGPPPTFGDAVLYTDFPGNIGVAPFDPASNLRLWATWTSVDGKESEPAGGTNGIAAATGLLEDQHIANLAVGKLLAGSIAVGQYIQSADYVAGVSGWRIATLPGGGAFMEINGGAIIGGSVIGADYIRSANYAADTAGWQLKADGTGQIGAFKVTNDGVQSTNYVANTSGWRWKNDGTGQIGQIKVTASALETTNYVAGVSGWRFTYGGDIIAPKFSIVGGAATFSGVLSAAQIDVGSAGTPVTFRDPANPSIPIWSVAHGLLQYHGSTAVSDGMGGFTYPPVTGTDVTFTSGNGATAIQRRVRTGTVRFSVIATAVVDQNFSLWYRVNAGAWIFLYMAIEPAGGYGNIAAATQLDLAVASGDVIEFGMAVTDNTGTPFNPLANDIRYGSLNVQGINF